MADPERGLWERPNFKNVSQFLKSNRISLACGPVMNTKLLKATVALVSCYIDEYVDFVPFSDAFGDMAESFPVAFVFEGHGSPPPG